MADQGVVSALNFCTTVVIARTCSTEVLGAYALGFSLIPLFACFQESLVMTPYTIFANRMNDEERTTYAGSALVHSAFLALLAVLVLAVAAIATHWRGESPVMATVLATLAGVIPLLLLREFCRRLGFAHFWTGSVCMLDSAIAMGQGLCLIALVLLATLNAATAHLSAGLVAGVMAGAWIFYYRQRFHISPRRVALDWRTNWQQGKWLFGGQLVGVVHAYAVLWLLALLINKEATGIFTACATVLSLSNPFLIGISNILGPHAARSHAEQGPRGVYRVVRQAFAVLGGTMSLFCLAVFLLGSWILCLFFGSKFTGQQATINVMALTFLASAVGMAADHGLRALARSEVAFATSLGGLIVTVATALLFIPPWGVLGAASAALCGSCVSSALRLFALVRLLAREGGGTPSTVPREVAS